MSNVQSERVTERLGLTDQRNGSSRRFGFYEAPWCFPEPSSNAIAG